MKRTAFVEEMNEQPQAILKTWEYFAGEGGSELAKIKQYIQNYGIHRFIFTGLGSSYFASLIAYYMLSASGIDCEVRDAGEFLLFQVPDSVMMGTAVILVSQSGESGEIIEILKKLEAVNWPKTHIWAITNTIESTLARTAGCKLITQAGPEKAVTSKTYVATIICTWLLATSIIQEPNFSDRMHEMIKKNANFISEFMKEGEQTGKRILEFLGPIDRLLLIGRGTSMATACQAALNFKEMPKIYAEAITGSMFRHGPIELVENKFRCIILESNPAATELNLDLAKKIATVWGGGKCVVISNQKMPWQTLMEELSESGSQESGLANQQESGLANQQGSGLANQQESGLANQQESGQANQQGSGLANQQGSGLANQQGCGQANQQASKTQADVPSSSDQKVEEQNAKSELYQSNSTLNKKESNILLISNPIFNQFLAPLYEIVVLQYVMVLLAEQRGFDTDTFRNSSKITKIQ